PPTPAIAPRTPEPPPPTPEPVKPAGPGTADVQGLASAGQWLQAADTLERALAAGSKIDGDLAGRVFFNASFIAACKNEPCDIATARKWAAKAGGYDDAAAAAAAGSKLSNPRWARTLDGFTKCDLNLKNLCVLAKLK